MRHSSQAISPHGQSGFTLLEMLTALAIMAILLGWGMPAFQDSIRANQVRAQANELISILNFSKSVAVRRNETVSILLTATGEGWNAIIEDPEEEAEVEGCAPGQLRCSSNNGINLIASVTQLDFNNRGYIRDAEDPWTPETLYLQHSNCTGTNQRRRIDITPTGQISSCTLACDTVAACP